jgi:hypothetical protein
MARRSRPRSGVVLLIVLILLMLLIVSGLTFAIISGQFRRAAEASGRRERVGDDPRQLTDRVMYQLLRDTPAGVRSSLAGQSLLRDLYGSDSAIGRLVSWTPRVAGQFAEIEFDNGGGSFRDQPGYYNGCVLTFSRASDATGDVTESRLSVRVVQYNPTSSSAGMLVVEIPEGDSAEQLAANIGSSFIINGRPFNGKGAGYELTTDTLDGELEFPLGTTELGAYTQPKALLPHYNNYPADVLIDADEKPNVGGMDEPWDAADYQNMYLAMIPANPASGIIPSFHRPALINYTLKKFADDVLAPAGITDPAQQVALFRYPFGPDLELGTSDDPFDISNAGERGVLQQILDLKRLVIMRPLPEDNPQFPNGAAFSMSYGMFDSSGNAVEATSRNLAELMLGIDSDGDGALDSDWLDVDNDGDGKPDSLWLDAGLPIQTSADGRRYKPMVAILCQDLDSRLNVNAHSNQWQRREYFAVTGQLSDAPFDQVAPFAGDVPRQLLLPRGLGFGPADIFLGHLFVTDTEYQQVMNLRYADSILNAAGISNTDDWLSSIKSLGIPADYVNQVSSYGMPPDLWGRGAVGLDYNGQPISIYSGQTGETVSDPYELVLNRPAAGNVDGPYTVAELERLLRWYDLDALSLPVRLAGAAPSSFGLGSGAAADAPRRRGVVTTHSSHVPVPSAMVPEPFRDELRTIFGDEVVPATSVLDLYRARLLAGGVDADDVQDHMLMMVPNEIWHGGRFDVNRWFGNGRDDNGNGVVDEPGEAADEVIWPSGTPGSFGDTDVKTPVPTNIHFGARQDFVRQLYCLMMLLTPEPYLHPTQEGLSNTYRRELTAQRIAQWAVNVVDFRDPDAIMTPFEYDIDPFDANTIDWDPTTVDAASRRIVWGGEYPDLLLTETVAFHDRRIKDTEYDNGPAKKVGPDDETLDQFRIPQGSLFFELYCSRNRIANNRQYPRELYTFDVRDNLEKLDLARRAPPDLYPQADVAPGVPNGDRIEISWPVWRIVISEPLDADQMPQQLAQNKPDSTSFNPSDLDLAHSVGNTTVSTDQIPLERAVWFTPGFSYVTSSDYVGAFADFDSITESAAFRPTEVGGTLLTPGGYAVVGPRETTRVGMIDDGDGLLMTMQRSPHMLLFPPTALGRTFRVIDNDGTERYAPPVPPLGIVCGAPAPDFWENKPLIGMNISEPVPNDSYYPEPTYRDTYADPDDPEIENGILSNPTLPDIPLDDEMGPLANDQPHGDEDEFDTVTDYRAAFLQRLANPLIPFHPLTNPYITVDWATLDLTVFNGDDNPLETVGADAIRFAARQRGNAELQEPAPVYGPNYPTGALDDDNFLLWNPFAAEPVQTQENVALTTYYFAHNLSHTLGYLNSTMGPPLTTPAEYVGSPETPFPWLTWLNRPFANPLEMMQVPASTPSRLLFEFGVYQSGTTTEDPYDSQSTPDVKQFRGTFSHLLNFFHSSKLVGTTIVGADFYRLFDYVGTPSPFVGAERWYDPDPNNGYIESYQPPFNHLSRFQDPGLVNINTISDSLVWEGIAKGFPAMDPSDPGGIDGSEMFRRIFESRRGYAGDELSFNSDFPTFFANPFRCADAADLMPDVQSPSDPGQNLRKSEPVQATLLREDLLTSSRTDALFVPDSSVVAQVEAEYQDQRRNPYFRYQGLARLSNLVTNNSNVFAVWITVGYFEVEPNPSTSIAPGGIDIAHPDGYRLGREVGSDSGQVERHRAFYIIDRSVPVAFEPGENHNVDRAVLLRRFIE